MLLLLVTPLMTMIRCFTLISDRLVVCSHVTTVVAMVTADDVIAGVT